MTHINADAIPPELRAWQHWVVWRWVEREGKRTKPPFNARTGAVARWSSQEAWLSFETVLAVAGRYDGIGVVLTGEEGVCGVDLDRCLDPDTGALAPWAAAIVSRLNSYTEVTPSGGGLRIWIKGQLPPGGRRKGQIELYDRDRYFTVTGQHWGGTPAGLERRPSELAALHAEMFPPEPERPAGKRVAAPVSLDDRELLDRARRAANGAKFIALYDRGDASAYNGDDSAADLALCNELAFWTGNDAGRMDRLFRDSALVREKWDRADYRERTITAAIQATTETYDARRSEVTEKSPPLTDADAPPASNTAINGREESSVSGGLSERSTLIDGRTLMAKEFLPLRWVLDGVIPEGLAIFAGPSKSCKSWLCVELCIAVASGGMVFGQIHAHRGDVLYLALEDSQRRIQSRFKTILRGEPMPSGIQVDTEWPVVGVGCEELIREWLTFHPKARLIIVDVLQKIRPPKAPGVADYEQDYRVLSPLQRISSEYRVGILVVTHTRKMQAEDPYDMISGSTAIQGAADTIIALMRIRGEKDATLHFTGRDVEGDALALQWDEQDCGWRLLGKAKDHRMSSERTAILEFLSTADDEMGPSDIAAAVGKSVTSVRYLLGQMVAYGAIKKASYGKYTMTEMQKENMRTSLPHTLITPPTPHTPHTPHTWEKREEV